MTQNIQSYLGRHVLQSPTSPEEFHKLAEKAWRERHVLVIAMEDPAVIIDDIHRQACENVGNKLYGKRVKS